MDEEWSRWVDPDMVEALEARCNDLRMAMELAGFDLELDHADGTFDGAVEHLSDPMGSRRPG